MNKYKEIERSRLKENINRAYGISKYQVLERSRLRENINRIYHMGQRAEDALYGRIWRRDK